MVATSGLSRHLRFLVGTYCAALVGTFVVLISEGSRAGLLSASYLLAGVICCVFASMLGKHAYRCARARLLFSDWAGSTS